MEETPEIAHLREVAKQAETLYDDKGRRTVESMDDYELLQEIARNQRQVVDLVQKFIEDMSKNPMLGAMAGMFGKKTTGR